MAAITPTTPFNGRLVQDGTYTTSGSWTTQVGSFDLRNTVPYPSTEVFNVYLFASQSSATNTGSVYLQDSVDNVNFNNVAAFAQPVLTATGSVNINLTLRLEPSSNRYIRASGSAGGAAAGAYGINLQF